MRLIIILVFLGAVSAFAALPSPNQLSLQQMNGGGTAFQEVDVSPVANQVLGFNQALTPVPLPLGVTTIAALRIFPTINLGSGYMVRTSGYYASGDGGQGVYYWVPTSGASDNGGTIIAPTGLALGRWFLLPTANLNVKQFGAYGDGSHYDDAAIAQAIAAAVNFSVVYPNLGTVYFPTGVFLVQTPSLLSICSSAAHSNIGSGSIGFRYVGEGMFNSVIRCNFGSNTGWLFDNGASSTHFQQIQFDNLGFEGMNPANYAGFSSLPTATSFFKLTYTSYSEQGAIFNNCRFDMFTKDFDFEGPGGNNCSEIKFNGCKFYRTASTCYTIDNPQSVDHEFHDTDIEEVFGDIFYIASGQGGSIKMYGGSIIQFTDGTSTNRYLLNAAGGGGPNIYPITFNGLRVESRYQWTNLLNLQNVEIDANFNDCTFLTGTYGSAANTNYVNVGYFGTAAFHKCAIYGEGSYWPYFNCTNTSGDFGQNGSIYFDTCAVIQDFSDYCVVQHYGAIRARGCHGLAIGAVPTGSAWVSGGTYTAGTYVSSLSLTFLCILNVSGSSTAPASDSTHWQPIANHYAMDFDSHWTPNAAGLVGTWTSPTTLTSDGSPNDPGLSLKIAYLIRPNDYWTISTNVQVQTLKLPKNAIIKSIIFLKTPAGSDSSALTLAVGNLYKGTAHLTTSSTANNVAINQVVSNYFYNVGSAIPDRILRFYATAGTPNATVQGGIILVEYY